MYKRDSRVSVDAEVFVIGPDRCLLFDQGNAVSPRHRKGSRLCRRYLPVTSLDFEKKRPANSIFIAKPYRHAEVLNALRSFE